MSNPQFIGQQCDVCERFLRLNFDRDEYETCHIKYATFYNNHSEAHRHARAAGWYLVEVDLCPSCRANREDDYAR